MNQEKDRKIILQEVPEEELSKYGWKLRKRADSNVFIILIQPGISLEKALLESEGVYARHESKDGQGNSLPSHVDALRKEMSRGKEVMETIYNHSIGHYTFEVLEKID